MSTGSSTAGETYTLQCSVNGTSEPTRFQWLMGSLNSELDDNIMMISGLSVTSNPSARYTQLQLRPLSQRLHNGSYCCSAMVVGISRPISKCFNVTVEGT